MIAAIQKAVTIPVMAKARIGHFVECQILQALEVDFIDESEVLTMADEENHIDKTKFNIPFVCGCKNLGEALRRIAEGAAMLRTKGEAGTGNIVRRCEGDAGISRVAQAGARDWQTSSSQLCRRWCCRSGRLCIDDAAWYGWRVRRLRYFQRREPRRASSCMCAGHHPLQQPKDPAQGQHEPGKANGWHHGPRP